MRDKRECMPALPVTHRAHIPRLAWALVVCQRWLLLLLLFKKGPASELRQGHDLGARSRPSSDAPLLI